MAYQGYLVIFVPFAFKRGDFLRFVGIHRNDYCHQGLQPHYRRRQEQPERGLESGIFSGHCDGDDCSGLGLLDLVIWYAALGWYYSTHPLLIGADKISAITSTMLCFGMGASVRPCLPGWAEGSSPRPRMWGRTW